MLLINRLISGTLMPMIISSLIFTPASCVSRRAEFHKSIFQEKAAIRLMIIDATTSKPIANTNVEVSEIVFCKKAPCPPQFLWNSKSDAEGIVQPAHSIVVDYTLVGAEKYLPQETRFATWNVEKQVWTIRLTRVQSDNHLGDKK